MTTETLDKLYLEWSQFTKARTAREIALVEALEFIRDGYDNQDVSHVDYRVKVYQVALDALADVGPSGERQ